MKSIVICFFCLLNIPALKAQTFNEWVRQKKTQEKYLLQQIAGLEVYAGYLKKGYDIFEKGSKTISKIKNGDFDMHQLFFSSKNKLNPNLAKLVADIEIESLSKVMTEKCSQSNRYIVAEPDFSAKQKGYFKIVVKRIEKNAGALFTDYEQLLGPDKITMDDEERLKRLMNLKREYLSLYRFINSFESELKWYGRQIEDEQHDISASKTILGLKP